MNFCLDEPLGQRNTLSLDACADALVNVSNVDELSAAIAWAQDRHLPVLALGEGSNIVVAGHVHALVIRQNMRGFEVLEDDADSVCLRIAAGENWHHLVQWTLQRGCYGLENLALIPGTVGAAPIQNIGAYGVELQSVLLRVHARSIVGDKSITLDNADCAFGYRDSVFKRELKDQLIITAIDVQLSRQGKSNTAYPALTEYFQEHPELEPTPSAVFSAVVNIRRNKLPDPLREPNAGSFFKNPMLAAETAQTLLQAYPDLPCFPQQDGQVKVSAAWMIDHCGWKGFRRNKQGVHERHALVLVNYGNNSGAQLLLLAKDISQSVYETFGVYLEIEPRVYGARA